MSTFYSGSKYQHLSEIKAFVTLCAIPFKSLVFFFIKKIMIIFFGGGGGVNEINHFIKQGCFKLIKSDDKDIHNVTKVYYFR